MKFLPLLSISTWGAYFESLVYSVLSFFKWPSLESNPKLIPYKSSSKLQGVETFDMISEWVHFKHPKGHIIVLTNINVEAKNIQFWAKVPRDDMIHFMKDLVILHCKDATEVTRLVENIPATFADAVGYSAGKPIIANEDL